MSKTPKHAAKKDAAKKNPKRVNVIGKISGWSAKHRATVLIATILASLMLGAGILRLEFRDNPVDSMPTGNPHTEAWDRVDEQYPGLGYANALYITIAPDRWAALNDKLQHRQLLGSDEGRDFQQQAIDAANEAIRQGVDPAWDEFGQGYPLARAPAPIPGPLNITDEVYMRAAEELYQHVIDEVDEIQWGITLPSQIKLVNYTNTGVPNPIPGQDALSPPDEGAFTMPGTGPVGSMQFASAWTTYWYASPDSIKSIVSSDWRTARMGLLTEPDGATLQEVGRAFYAAIDSYRDRVDACDASASKCDLQWPAFDVDSVIVDPRTAPTASAHLTDITVEDVLFLSPFVAVFIAGSLFLAFRRIGIVTAMLIPMGLAGIGVMGTFGLIDLPIHSVSLLVFPILMGNGIDFAIHMTTSYHRARGDGADCVEAARRAGHHAGTPLFIATMTTLAGMALLVFAPNKLLSQLGLSIMLGMALLLLVSLMTLPAALTFSRPLKQRDGVLGKGLIANARFWNKNKLIGGLLVTAVVVAGGLQVTKLDTLIVGTPANYFPEDDPQRLDYERSNEIFYQGQDENLVSNGFILEGDFTRPEAMAFLADMERTVQQIDFVRKESAVSIYFALNAWIQVREGTAGAPLVIAQEASSPGSTFPDTQEGIKFLMDEMFDTPLRTYSQFFVAYPDYKIGSMLVEIRQDDDFDGLEEQWDTLVETIDAVKARHPNANMDVHIMGGTAVGYLFTAEEMPYLNIAAGIGLAATALLVLAIRRSFRDAATVAAVVGCSGVAWLGALALLDIPLSIALVVPVVLIAAIGSDYALHMRYSLRDEGAHAWATVGRAVFYSALTDLGAFLIFTQMRYGILKDATMATVFALGICLVMTMILVPILSSRKEMQLPDPQPKTLPKETPQ